MKTNVNGELERNAMKHEYDISTQDVVKFLKDKKFVKAVEYFRTQPIFNILGVQRAETKHSAFISWLLGLDIESQSGFSPLKMFLLECKKLVDEKYNNNEAISEEYHWTKDIIDEKMFLNDISITTESPISTDSRKRGRLDIFAFAKIRTAGSKSHPINLIIENKIYSGENQDQTKKYYEWGKQQGAYTLFVFLTPLANNKFISLKESRASQKEFIEINYQWLVEKIIEPIYSRIENFETRLYIKDYLKTLSRPSFEEDEKLESGKDTEEIMAIESSVKELLVSIWNENPDLMYSIMKAKLDFDSEDESLETKQALTSLIKKIEVERKKRGENTRIYFIDENGNKTKAYTLKDFVIEITKKYFVKHQLTEESMKVYGTTNQKNKETNEVITYSYLEGHDKAFKYSKNAGKYNGFDLDTPISIGGVNYYIMRVWLASESPIRKVIDVAKELGFRVYKVYQGVEEEL